MLFRQFDKFLAAMPLFLRLGKGGGVAAQSFRGLSEKHSFSARRIRRTREWSGTVTNKSVRLEPQVPVGSDAHAPRRSSREESQDRKTDPVFSDPVF
ncbi:MAG: hypothetical protein ABL999_13100 [Pyrinomonadaceae bacterium]